MGSRSGGGSSSAVTASRWAPGTAAADPPQPCTTLCCTMLHYATLCHIMPPSTALHCAELCRTLPRHTLHPPPPPPLRPPSPLHPPTPPPPHLRPCPHKPRHLPDDPHELGEQLPAGREGREEREVGQRRGARRTAPRACCTHAKTKSREARSETQKVRKMENGKWKTEPLPPPLSPPPFPLFPLPPPVQKAQGLGLAVRPPRGRLTVGGDAHPAKRAVVQD